MSVQSKTAQAMSKDIQGSYLERGNLLLQDVGCHEWPLPLRRSVVSEWHAEGPHFSA